MRRLWQRMAEIYGHRWTSAYGDDAGASAGQTWARGLSGLAPAQIASGLDSVLASADEWPPTLPQFRAMCFGIPALAAVRAEIEAKDTRRSPFTRWVMSNIRDVYRFRTDGSRAERMLAEAYAAAREHVMRGGELPPEPVAEIEKQPEQRTPASAETARSHLDSIASSLRLVDIDQGGDGAVAEHRMEARGS